MARSSAAANWSTTPDRNSFFSTIRKLSVLLAAAACCMSCRPTSLSAMAS
jgi:hypothetical protein